MSRFSPGVELNIGGAWVDVTDDVRTSADIVITRGRRDEAAQVDPAQCTLTLNNRHGRYSPRLPTSPYYGLIGRNTPLRVSVPYDSVYLWVKPGDDTSGAAAPDAAALGITGDIDIRVEVDAEHWNTGDLAGKFETTGNQRSWWFGVEDGRLVWTWSANGSTTVATARSNVTAPLPVDRGRLAVRVTLDVNNGTGGRTTTFYTAPTIAGPWTQLGAAVVNNAATTSIFDSTAPVEVGGVADVDVGDDGPIPGNYLAFELRSGIAGTVVANPDFTAQTPGDTSFADTAAAPNTWTVSSTAELRDRLYRFTGEVAEWPPSRDISGADATVEVQAAGISRRLLQGDPPLRSSMYRDRTNPARQGMVGYWPLEDGPDARQAASALPGVQAARIYGTPTMAEYSDWTASGPMPVMGAGSIAGFIPLRPATGEISVLMFVYVRSAVAADTSLLHLRSTTSQWEVRLDAAGDLTLKAWDASGDALDDGAGPLDTTVAFGMNSRGFAILNLSLTQNGANVDWNMQVFDFVNTGTMFDALPWLSWSGSIAATVGAPRAVTIGRDKGLTDVVVGHLSVADDDAAYQNTLGPFAAWNGEEPSDRMRRLCGEEQIEYVLTSRGWSGNTVALGDQRDKSLMATLREAADTDAGILHESRDWPAIAYRSRLSLQNQAPALELSSGGGELNSALVPVDDDRYTANDITLTREGGSEQRIIQATGPLNVQAPPAGVGRYDTSATVSLRGDGQLRDHAGWLLHLGTTDEARFPLVQVNLAHRLFTGDPDFTAEVLRVDVGDRLAITDPPGDLPPDDLSLLVLGYTETLSPDRHVIAFNCAPESPYHIGVYDDTGSRYDTGGSEVVATPDPEITFVQDAQTNNTASTGSVTVAVPAGTTAGDVMVAFVALISTTAITAPAGWTLIGTQTGGANSQIAAYYRVAGTEPANYTWSWSSTFKNTGWIGTYRGVDPAAPVVDSDSSSATVTAAIATDAVTSAEDTDWLITAAMERHAATGSGSTWTSSAGTDAERVDQGSNAGSGQDTSMAVYDSAGPVAVGSHTRTLTATQTASQLASWAVVLKAEPAPVGLMVASAGPLWTTDAAEMPFDIFVAGERMTVTAISGATSPQTFTVTRAVNGITKDHPSGTPVRLFSPVYRGL